MEKIEVTGTEGCWEYQKCEVTVGNSDLNRCCMMCGHPMRFIHFLALPDERGRVLTPGIENRIRVGVDCAAILIDGDPDIPRLAENETKRKEEWRIRYENPGTCKTTIGDLEERGKL